MDDLNIGLFERLDAYLELELSCSLIDFYGISELL